MAGVIHISDQFELNDEAKDSSTEWFEDKVHCQQQQNSHDGKSGRQNGAVADKENRGSSVYIADKSSGKGGKSKDKVKSNTYAFSGHFSKSLLSIRG